MGFYALNSLTVYVTGVEDYRIRTENNFSFFILLFNTFSRVESFDIYDNLP